MLQTLPERALPAGRTTPIAGLAPAVLFVCLTLVVIGLAAGAVGWIAYPMVMSVSIAAVLGGAVAGYVMIRRPKRSFAPLVQPPDPPPSLKLQPATDAASVPTKGSDHGTRLRGLFEEGPIGVAILDETQRIREANPAFDVLLAREASAPPDGELDAPLAEWLDAANDADLGAALANPTATSLDVTFGPDRQQSGTLFLGPAEGARRVAHLIDTSRQKKLEVQFAQSQKMLAVGKLAGGIAHDFNNLLTAMTGFCDLLLLRHQPGDPSFADIMQIKHNANRAANLVRQLLAFSRQQTLQPRVLNLADVIADLSNLLQRLLGAGIELRVEHGADICPVRVDRVQLEQVLINLAVNSRDAMDGAGDLTIRSRDVLPSQINNPPRHPPLPPGRWVLIQVSDTGSGIPPEHLDRVFEPFFTTKGVGEGTGLGLSTVYGIVKQTDGYIYAENPPEGGALFSVYLPAYEGHALETGGAPQAAPNRADLTGAGSVLLVEDEDPVRMFGARALRSKGYNVTEARTGQAALTLLDSREEPFDLLITDVVMPEMDGPTLIEHVRGHWPDMRVICISGYAEGTFRDKLGQFDDLYFLAKPFTLQQLAGKVKEIMAA